MIGIERLGDYLILCSSRLGKLGKPDTINWREMITKALLINPPTGLYIREDRCQSKVSELAVAQIRPPLDLIYIGAILEKEGVQCQIRDYPLERGNWSSLKADLKDFNPDTLIISATTPTLSKDLKATSLAKELNPQILTMAKGAHFLVFAQETLLSFPQLDLVIRGEVEQTIQELAKGKDFKDILGITYREVDISSPDRQEERIIKNNDRPFIEDLNSLPFPARHLINNNLYIRADTKEPQTTIQTNRGCPNQCIFCLTKLVSGTKLRARAPENIADEIEICLNKYKIKDFFFRGDTFTWDKSWTIEVCKEIIKRNLKINWVCNSRVDTLDEERLYIMKRSGCWGISLGVESGNQEMLKKMNKNITLSQAKEAVRLCSKFGILSYVYLLLGLPWESKETIKDSSRFALDLDADLLEVHFAYPFPGTKFYDLALKYKLLSPHNFPEDAYAQPSINTLSLSKSELLRWKRKILLKFYLRPKFIFRTLRRVRRGRPKGSSLWNYLQAGISLLKATLIVKS